jgi:hypothetical protein
MEIRFRCSVGADRKFVFFERLTNDSRRQDLRFGRLNWLPDRY